MPLTTTKSKVAVAPFADMSVRTVARGEGAIKVGLVENRSSMTQLAVLFPTADGTYKPGMSILLRSNLYTSPWAKEVQEFEGVKFILVPVDHVEATVTPAP